MAGGQPKTRTEARHKAVTYWHKAMRFARASRANASTGDWDPAVANAVNAIINVTDALTVHYMGVRSAGESHFDSLNLLASTDLDPQTRQAFARHLESLLNVKTISQYEGRLLEDSDWRRADKHLQRAFDSIESVSKSNGWPTLASP